MHQVLNVYMHSCALRNPDIKNIYGEFLKHPVLLVVPKPVISNSKFQGGKTEKNVETIPICASEKICYGWEHKSTIISLSDGTKSVPICTPAIIFLYSYIPESPSPPGGLLCQGGPVTKRKEISQGVDSLIC